MRALAEAEGWGKRRAGQEELTGPRSRRLPAHDRVPRCRSRRPQTKRRVSLHYA
jgi:hypothetical protein